MFRQRHWLSSSLSLIILAYSLYAEGAPFAGLKLDPNNTHFIELRPEAGTLLQSQNLPSFWDWRKVNGVNWLSSVRDQEGCGSCVAFGLASVFESQLKIHKGLWWWNPLISVQDLFACGGGDCGTGWTIPEALHYTQTHGLTDEACAPYIARSGPDHCAPCVDRNFRHWKPEHIIRPTQGQANMESIKRALQFGPLWTHMLIYDDFREHRFGVYRHSWGNIESGHTIAIIGYEDRRKAWIVKNSWGSQWGEQGYGYIHYDDISGLGNETYQFVFNEHQPYAVIQNIDSGQVIQESTLVTIHSNLKSGSELILKAHSPTQQQSQTLGSCLTPNCDIQVTPEQLLTGSSRLEIISDGTEKLATWPVEVIRLASTPQNQKLKLIRFSKVQQTLEDWSSQLNFTQGISKVTISIQNLSSKGNTYSKTITAPQLKNRLKVNLKEFTPGKYQILVKAFWVDANGNKTLADEADHFFNVK